MAKVTSASLKAVAFGGLIREDVMNQIWDISNIPLPFADAVGSGSHTNAYCEWTQNTLAAPNLSNAVIDGADVTSNNEALPVRVGNQSQISAKRVQVSTRSQNSDVIGQNNALAWQIMERQKELRRDVDAIAVSQQASVADNGSSTAGQSAGLGAWLVTNVSRAAGGANGGFSSGIVATPTTGTTPRALSEATVRDIAQSIYQNGGNCTLAMSMPAVIRKFSEYLFSSTAKVATMFTDLAQSREAAVAKGAANVFVTDFGVVLELVANRLQALVTTSNANFYLIDPQYLELSYMQGYTTEALAKTGTSDTRMMTVDWSLKVLSEKAQGVVADVNGALAAVA